MKHNREWREGLEERHLSTEPQSTQEFVLNIFVRNDSPRVHVV